MEFRRFELEAEALGRLSHRGIARIFDAGAHTDGDVERPWYAMELIDGVDILTHAADHALDRRARLRLITELCDSLQHAHERGVIHRDLKPANVLVDESGQSKVLDFGVARLADPDLATTLATGAGQLLGTIGYMSPEQATGDPRGVDARSDVYALGVLAYELLTGSIPIPIDGLSLPEALHAIQDSEPRPLDELDPDLRGDLDTVVTKALAKEPERRYATAAEFGADLRRVLDARPVIARPPSAIYQLSRFARRNKALVGGIASGVGVALVSLTSALWLSLLNADRLRESELTARQEASRASLAAATSAIELGRIVTAQDYLEAVEPEFRAWEWRHLQAELDTSDLVVRHGATVTDAALSDGDTHVVSVDSAGHVLRTRVADGPGVGEARLSGPLPPPTTPNWLATTRIALSADGAAIAVAFESMVRVHDAETGAELASADVGATVAEVAVDRGGDRIGIVGDSGTWLWDRGASDAGPSQLGTEARDRVRFTPKGWLMTAVSDFSRIECYDAAGALLAEPSIPHERLGDLALIDGGKTLLYTTYWKPLSLRGGVERSLSGHTARPRSVAWDPRSRRIVSGGEDRTVRVWDLDSASTTTVLSGPKSAVDELYLSEGGGAVLAVAGDEVRVWNLTDSFTTVLPHPDYVYGLRFEASGTLLTQDFEGRIRRFDTSGQILEQLTTGTTPVRLGGPSHRSWTSAVQFSELLVLDERLATVSCWKAPGRITDQDAASDGDRLAVRTAGTVSVHAAPELEELWSADLSAHGLGPVRNRAAVGLSPDGRRIAFEEQPGTVVVVDVDDDTRILELEGLAPQVTALRWSPDGTAIARGTVSGDLDLIDLATASSRSFTGHSDQIFALAFHPSGRRLASGSNDTTIRVWDLTDGETVLLLADHVDYVHELAFSIDGTRLASASGDGSVRLYDSLPRHARRSERGRDAAAAPSTR